MLTSDELHVVGSAHQLGLILSSQWPDVAAHLVAQGADGQAVAELAGLSQTTSPWIVDHLVPQVLTELGITESAPEEAGDWVGRLLGQAVATRTHTDAFAAVRALARLSPVLEYPGGVIADAYYASEWLDCDCHAESSAHDEAVALEDALRTGPPLTIDPGLLAALTAAII